MDRRTVLAFALIFLVYVGWLQLYKHLYQPQRAPAPESAAAPGAPMQQEGATAAQAQPASAGWSSPAPALAASQPASDHLAAPLQFLPVAQQPDNIHVATDLYELEICPTGARIAAWRGLRFKGADGEPVRLVPQDAALAAPGDGDRLFFQRGEIDLSAAPYRYDGATAVRLGQDDGARSLVFEAVTEAGLVVRKIFTFHADRYSIDLDLEVALRDDAARVAIGPVLGDPLQARFAWPEGIGSTERNQKWERDSFRAIAMVGEEMVVKMRRAMGADARKVQAELQGSVRFAAVQNKYFLIAGYAQQAAQGRAVEGRVHLDGDPARGEQTWWIELPLTARPGATVTGARLGLYVGPSEYQRLAEYGVGLEKTVDLGWKMFQPLAAITLRFMNWLYRWIPNYGIVIILLSILVKVIFYPLTRSSTRSMKRMQEVAPRIKALQEKLKGNQQKLSEEMMKLYKEEKINPMGGCLPMLLQMPVFIALYQVLRSDIALRQAPFTLWIRDLGQPDALFTLPFSIPFLGNEFNLLPLLMAASTYWQMKLTPTAPAGGPSMQLMNKLMPVMMLFFFYSFPAGLVLYWLVMNLVSVYQTWRIHTTIPATGGSRV